MRVFLSVVTLFACHGAFAQEQQHYFVPIAHDGQKLRGSAGAGNGAIGLDGKKVEGGFKVVNVVSASPAEQSGIQVNDVITSIEGKSVASAGQAEFNRLLDRKPGDTIQVSYLRSGQQVQIPIRVESRSRVYPAESQLSPAVSQFVFDGHGVLTVAVSQMPAQSQSLTVWLMLSNVDAPPVTVDDSKFFVLDGQGQQLRHMSFEEVKYSIQSWVAQNWRAGNYPAPTPPPPQHHYVITGTQNGNYMFTEMGNMGTLSGNSTSTYNVQEQPDNGQAGYMLGYSLGLAIRRHADRKHNDQVAQQAQQSLAQLDNVCFKSQSPLIPGENRKGGILYWTGSTRQAAAPFKVVLFLNNPISGNQETAQFEFR